ncbi:MAG: haloacid dehalogenase [Chloroflexi bacterium]|nr:haloacid dehalogenase [Chloroflexota bacterium]
MDKLDQIADRIHTAFEAHTQARDAALAHARTLTRHCAHAIRAVHREERANAETELAQAAQLAAHLRAVQVEYPAIYYAGYTQDALKEYAEANIVLSLILDGGRLPNPEDLAVENDTYLKGLSEAVGELRRRCLDLLRHGYSHEVERLLQHMDDIYNVLVTMDYPDAVTGGLRRLTDIARSIIERTRGDVTLSMRQQRLQQALRRFERKLGAAGETKDQGEG